MTFSCIIKCISINVFRNFSNFNIVSFREINNFDFRWTSWFLNAWFRVLRLHSDVLKEVKIGSVVIWIINVLSKSWIELSLCIWHHYLLRFRVEVCSVVWTNEYEGKRNSNISTKFFILTTKIVSIGCT